MSKSIGYFFLITLFCYKVNIISGIDCFEPYCNCDEFGDEIILTCDNFTRYDELNFKANQIAFNEIRIRPSGESLVLNTELDLTGLILNSKNYMPRLFLYDIKSIDYKANVFRSILFTDDKIMDLYISESNFRLSAEVECSSLKPNGYYAFSDLNLNIFELQTTYFFYTLPICPQIFTNSTINSFVINYYKGRMTISSIENENFHVRVNELVLNNGKEKYFKELNSNSLLNLNIFEKLTHLKLTSTFMEGIEFSSISKLTNLRKLTLTNVKLRNLLSNSDVKWLKELNASPTKQPFSLIIGKETDDALNFDDNDLCLFRSFPHSEPYVIPRILDADELPCSCTMVWLYKEFPKYKDSLNQDYENIPIKCLEQLNEQISYCNFNKTFEACQSIIQQTTIETPQTTSLSFDVNKNCIVNEPKCKCSFEVFNYLDCSDPWIKDVPMSFEVFHKNIQWNYVTFVGSSIKEIEQFYSLALDQDASLVVSNVDFFDNNIFFNTNSNGKFSFIILNSNLFSLAFRRPFTNVNLKLLEFDECVIQQPINMNVFEGSSIDVLSIKKPQKENLLLRFQQYPLYKITKILKLKIDKAYSSFLDSFSKFGLDSFTLSPSLFKYLKEIEVTDTYLNYISSYTLKSLKELSTIKLYNVRFLSVINEEFEERKNFKDFNPPDAVYENWLSFEHIQHLYIGKENDFHFEDDYICFFADMHENLNVYIYDSIDSPMNLECTCTIYFIYRNYNFTMNPNNENYKYIPKCILESESNSNINDQVQICLHNMNIKDYCNTLVSDKITTTELDEEITSYATISSYSTFTLPTEKLTKNDSYSDSTTNRPVSNDKSDVIYILTIIEFVVIGLIVAVLVPGVIYIFKIRKFISKSLTLNDSKIYPMNKLNDP